MEKRYSSWIANRCYRLYWQTLESPIEVLREFWEKLLNVTQLSFQAKTHSKKESGWNRKGRGEIVLTKNGNHVLIFNEKGTWQGEKGIDVSFTNLFRWTLDSKANMISLEHLRRGSEHPVFLCNLTPSGKYNLSSVDSHLCGGDKYFGQIHLDHHNLRLNWRVIGPNENEELDYYYYS